MLSDRFLTSARYARFFNIVAPIIILSLIALGWYIVYAQIRSTESTIVASFQYTQLKLMQSVARSVHETVRERIEKHGTPNLDVIEQEILDQYIKPLRLLANGDAWIYAPDRVVFDLSSDFPEEYRGKSMAQIFEIQKNQGASHYEEMVDQVMNAREGVGWYIWLPNKGKEIAAWAPVRFGEFVWIVGISTPQSEIFALAGASDQRRTSILLMSLATLITLTLMGIWWLSSMRRFRAESALKTNQEALRETQKMESLGVMAGGIAHDFNNLLVAMLGQSSLAMRKLGSEHPALPHVEKTMKAAERASNLTQQLLAYAGKTQIMPERLDVNELILDNLRLFEVTVPATVDLQHNLKTNLPQIEADTGQIQQILMNLIMNGAEAIGNAVGTVTVRTDVITVSEGQTIYSQPTATTITSGEYVLIEISDTGIGMDEKTVKRIFDPFFTTKSTGRGLGLAAVLGIVRGHQGSLVVESKVGHGTTFRLYFPAKKGDTLTVASPTRLADKAPLTSKGVLLIDDEESMREFGTDVLQTQGISVLTAASGQAGLELFKLQRENISLIVLDAFIAGLASDETLVKLREIDTSIPIIVASIHTDRASESELLRKGATSFLSKPFTADRFLEEIQQHSL